MDRTPIPSWGFLTTTIPSASLTIRFTSTSGNYNEQVNPNVNAFFGGDTLSAADYAAGSDIPDL